MDADGETAQASDTTGSLPEAGTGSVDGSSAGEDDSEMAPPDLPDNGDPTALPEDFADRFSGSAAGDAERDEPAAPSAGGDAETAGGGAGRPGGMSGSGGDFGFNAPGGGSSATDPSGWIAIAVSALILAAGLVIAKRYRH